MPTERLTELPADALALITERTGPVIKYETVGGGLNSEIAARIHTADTTAFVKGLRSGHPRAWTQKREADINPHVRGIAPALLWRAEAGGWDLIAFEDADGRHADYTPGSPDLPLIADTLAHLSTITAPEDVTVRTMPDRMRNHTPDPDLFDGAALLHTDWFPTNVLIHEDRVRVVDWAWASRGAAWIDAALWTVWLIRSGHTPAQAEQWAARVPAWTSAPRPAVDAFAAATVSVWEEITQHDPEPWTLDMLTAARTWHNSR
ncbi:aminoglycoside phosphotransferase [Streptomyces sp. APSN-46.1]|uniref:aminoglycoside phosphotransferase n=1 Tax=Streptomyces sp. APSN-46.1 TaxID=2929049 RepID=UPI001FB1AAC5|nr:aminoglycoside phosphotransferase [Streptomyces sp. APSN-46.1]MCJ1677584.1 aminoglycoside phosphotransferase [Streptomyces sp. APSN-46.1]